MFDVCRSEPDWSCLLLDWCEVFVYYNIRFTASCLKDFSSLRCWGFHWVSQVLLIKNSSFKWKYRPCLSFFSFDHVLSSCVFFRLNSPFIENYCCCCVTWMPASVWWFEDVQMSLYKDVLFMRTVDGTQFLFDS